MQVLSTKIGKHGSYKDRNGSTGGWGVHGKTSIPSKEYQENFKKVFGDDSKKTTKREEKILSPEQRAKQQAYPY